MKGIIRNMGILLNGFGTGRLIGLLIINNPEAYFNGVLISIILIAVGTILLMASKYIHN